MAKPRTPGQRIRDLRNFRHETQAQFGKHFGVGRGAVSAWEVDDELRKPSVVTYLKLAMLALNPDDIAFFLALAEIEQKAIFSLAERLNAERLASASEGELVQVRPLPGTSDSGTLLLHRSLVPNPNFTYYAINMPNTTWLALAFGLIVIDTKDAGDLLAPFWDDVIIVRSKQSFRGEPEHVVGKLHMMSPKGAPGQREMEPPTAVVAGDSEPGPSRGMIIGRHTDRFWEAKRLGDLSQEDLVVALQKFHAALNLARQDMRLLPMLEIVGRVIEWIAYPNPRASGLPMPPATSGKEPEHNNS